MRAHAAYVLGLADDALVLSQRCAQWVTRAPQLEEDVALANIGLDLLGQARSLLGHAGELEGAGRDEDDLAYLRGAEEFRNVRLVELPNEDFAVSTARLLVVATYQLGLYDRLRVSSDPTLAAVAGKAVKEVAYHREHAASWVVRLGDGTAESTRRMAAGLDRVWPYVDELFADEGLDPALVEAGVAVRAAELRPGWESSIGAVLDEAGLAGPESTWRASGGRRGEHAEDLAVLLEELQQLHRAHPGATW